MTKLSTDFSAQSGFASFNTLYDQIFDGATIGTNKTFPAPRLLTPTGSPGEYPNDGRNVTIPADQSGNGSIFTGDLTTFDPAGHLRGSFEPISHAFATEGEFFASGLAKRQNTSIHFQKPFVAIVSGDLDLSPLVETCAPVVLCATGKIKVGAILRKVPAGKVVLYSLNGDIETVGGKMEGALLAPNGMIRLGGPLDLTGIFCANSLDPASLGQHGGTLLYDQELDPTDPKRLLDGFLVLLGPETTSTLKR